MGFAQIEGSLAPGAEQTFTTSGLPICYYGALDEGVSINSFRYAAQGTVVSSP